MAAAVPRELRTFEQQHPVHIIQALLGHASPDTVMIYPKLYPSRLIEEYRKTVRDLYKAYYGEEAIEADPAIEYAIQQCELLPNPEWNCVPV
jgi:hypothetical protein